jgi:hypothetical protein
MRTNPRMGRANPDSKKIIPPQTGVGGEYRVRQTLQTRSLAKATNASGFREVCSVLPHWGQTLLIGNLLMCNSPLRRTGLIR